MRIGKKLRTLQSKGWPYRLQAAGLQLQMASRPGAETLNQAVAALEAAAGEIISVDGGDHSPKEREKA
jgi:hypothetical protein